jgi:hypothetical protein
MIFIQSNMLGKIFNLELFSMWAETVELTFFTRIVFSPRLRRSTVKSEWEMSSIIAKVLKVVSLIVIQRLKSTYVQVFCLSWRNRLRFFAGQAAPLNWWSTILSCCVYACLLRSPAFISASVTKLQSSPFGDSSTSFVSQRSPMIWFACIVSSMHPSGHVSKKMKIMQKMNVHQDIELAQFVCTYHSNEFPLQDQVKAMTSSPCLAESCGIEPYACKIDWCALVCHDFSSGSPPRHYFGCQQT